MDNTDIDQLKAENSQLKTERDLLYAQLKKLNQKLKESDSFRSNFLSNISNEIVNPFTSILGISKNISTLEGSDIIQIHAMADLVYREAFDLDFQLRNIFAAAKIESGDNNLELVNLRIHEFVIEIIENLRNKAKKNALFFEFTSDFKKKSFTSDADKLRIILINLIMNAITFSDQKNKISIHAELDTKGFLFKITNQGITIPNDMGEVIFDRFKKLDSSINSLNQGHGLGLSIIKDYVELFGGQVNFVSNEENGTTFTINLPPIDNSEQELYMQDEDLFTSDDAELF